VLLAKGKVSVTVIHVILTLVITVKAHRNTVVEIKGYVERGRGGENILTHIYKTSLEARKAVIVLENV